MRITVKVQGLQLCQCLECSTLGAAKRCLKFLAVVLKLLEFSAVFFQLEEELLDLRLVTSGCLRGV